MLIEDCVPIDRKQTLLTDRCFKMQILNPAIDRTRLPVLLAKLRFVAMYDQPADSKLDPILVRWLFYVVIPAGVFPSAGGLLYVVSAARRGKLNQETAQSKSVIVHVRFANAEKKIVLMVSEPKEVAHLRAVNLFVTAGRPACSPLQETGVIYV